ncbi:MAG: hypothetical protein JNG89_13780, partial [Planctomycetaceae bacterium]|nr:hypothetical protein [Planctomycetaceae bacterium]
MLLLLQMCGLQVPLSFSDAVFAAQTFLAEFPAAKPVFSAAFALLTMLALIAFGCWLTMRSIPNNSVGVVEKLWSLTGSVPEGRIVALNGEAGYQVDLLRGGIHLGYWRWQYAVHTARLVTIPQGKIGYIYARDGEPLPPQQTLGRVIDCNQFQDAQAFLNGVVDDKQNVQRGQRGRQRAILREGVYAINPALFIIMTEDAVFALPRLQTAQERALVQKWSQELTDIRGFDPVVVGRQVKS